MATRGGEILRLPPGSLPVPVVELVDRMLLADPAARPTIAETHAALMGIRIPTTTTAVLTGPVTAVHAVGPDTPQGQGAAHGRRTGVVACARARSRPAAGGEAAGAKRGTGPS